MNAKAWLTTGEVAEKLDLTPGRVRQIAQTEGIGSKVGRDWLFTEEDVRALKARNRHVGRPRKKALPDSEA